MSHVSGPRLSRISAVWCLITLLQNLTSLTLESESLAGSILADIVERVAEANRDPTSPSHGKALTKLRTLSATSDKPMYSAHLNFYRSFAMLPSMRSLRGCMSDGQEMGCRWPESFQPGSSMVTTIQLGVSAVAAHNFEALFGGIAALKHFTYEYGSVARGSGPYEPVGIIDALRRHAYHSLKSLSITRIDSGYKWEARTIGPLHTFTSLKSIRLEDVLFAIPCPDDRSSEDDSSRGDYGDWRRQPCVMSRLVDLLPASVKAFTLVRLMYDKHTRDLLEGLAELKEIKVPKLTRLTVDSPDLFDQEMKDSLKSAGIKLRSWNTPI
ncbi:MAG: hypothetical protein Q9188_000896 [Gyalolechia gomerana]